MHVNKTSKFDPSSKIFEVMRRSAWRDLSSGVLPLHCTFQLNATVSSLQISKRWKLLSIEQQQQELEAKKKSKAAAKEQAKKAAGNKITLNSFFSPTVSARVPGCVLTLIPLHTHRGKKESEAELPGVSAERCHSSPAGSGESFALVSCHFSCSCYLTEAPALWRLYICCPLSGKNEWKR